MTIDEALKILTIATPERRTSTNADYHDAIKLGIEALKHIDLARRSRDVRIIDSLPSETKT